MVYPMGTSARQSVLHELCHVVQEDVHVKDQLEHQDKEGSQNFSNRARARFLAPVAQDQGRYAGLMDRHTAVLAGGSVPLGGSSEDNVGDLVLATQVDTRRIVV